MPSRNFILHNFGWKLLSLLLAALAWLTIEADFQKVENSQGSPVITTSQRTLAVPLVLMTSATGTNRFKASPPTVAVELSGTADNLRRLIPTDIEALVDATDVDDETQFRRKIRVNFPRDVQVVSVSPEYATVERITGPK